MAQLHHHMRGRLHLPTMSIGGSLKKFQEYPISNFDSRRDVFGAFWVAQLFTVATAHRITQLVLPLSRTGSPGTVRIGIQAISGGDPDGTDLSFLDIDGDLLQTPGGPSVMQTLQIPGADLSAAQFAIVIRATGGSAGNTINWDTDDSSPTYAGGSRTDSADSGASWSPQSGTDMCFEEWGLET